MAKKVKASEPDRIRQEELNLLFMMQVLTF